MGFPTVLGQNIFALRVARNWAQSALAKKAKISQAQIARIERGDRRDMFCASVKRIADAFGVTVDELLRDKDNG